MMTPKNRTRVSKLYENALHGMRLNGNQKFTAIESGEAEHVVWSRKLWHAISNLVVFIYLKIFQRFRLVKFIEKFKTHVKNLKIEKIIAIPTSIYTSCSSLFIFTSVKTHFLRWKIIKLLIWLTFLQNAAVIKVFKNSETVDCRQTFPNRFWNSNLHWKQFFRSSSISIRCYQS